MSGAYSPYGPWNNNAAPAISPAFLNALEAFLQTLNAASYDGNITSDGAGNFSIVNTGNYQIAGVNVLSSPSSHDLLINVPNLGGGHKCYIQVGGVNKFSVDASGNVRAAGTITASTTP